MSGFLLDTNCISEVVRTKPEPRVLQWMEVVDERWGLLAAEARRKGRTLSAVDGLLAATALHHNLTIVSRNVNDFASAQAQILSPWEA
jgi:predicted nucleic acid-binding protein